MIITFNQNYISLVCIKFEKSTHANEIMTTSNIKKINWIAVILCYSEELIYYFMGL